MNLRLPFVLCACLMLALGMARAQGPSAGQLQLQPGEILLSNPKGDVWLTTPGGTESKVSDQRMRVSEKAAVRTGANSSVVLIFANKAQTQLGPNTLVVVEKYKEDRNVASSTGGESDVESHQSDTLLALEHGDLSGKVKLRKDGGSSFTVRTPVGAAGIRGTTFRIVYIPAGPGQAFGTFTLTNANGLVNFTPTGQGGGTGSNAGTGGAGTSGGTSAPGTGDGGQGQGANQPGTSGGAPSVTATGTVQGLAIPPGQQIEIIVVQNAQGQFVPQVPVSSNSAVPIPTALVQQITQISTAIAQAVQEVVFTPPTPAPSSGSGTTGGTPSTGTGTTESGTGGSGQSGSNQPSGTQSTPFTTQAGGTTATGQVQQTQPPPRIPETINTNPGPR